MTVVRKIRASHCYLSRTARCYRRRRLQSSPQHCTELRLVVRALYTCFNTRSDQFQAIVVLHFLHKFVNREIPLKRSRTILDDTLLAIEIQRPPDHLCALAEFTRWTYTSMKFVETFWYKYRTRSCTKSKRS